MQNSAPCSAHQAKATQNNLRNVVPDFAVEKRLAELRSSHKTGWATAILVQS